MAASDSRDDYHSSFLSLKLLNGSNLHIGDVGFIKEGSNLLNLQLDMPHMNKRKSKRKMGSRDGAVVRALASHQCGPSSIPGLAVICGLSLLLVLVLPSRGFSPGTPVFPFPPKSTLLNSNSIWKVSPISALH